MIKDDPLAYELWKDMSRSWTRIAKRVISQFNEIDSKDERKKWVTWAEKVIKEEKQFMKDMYEKKR